LGQSLDNPYPESLHEAAAEAYALSSQLCRGCGDLHALWPYIRLTRASTGVETQQSSMQTELRGFFDRGLRHVLIAGCQDTGLLALVARAGAGHQIKITVLDICETPLELCRRTARRWSLPIDTLLRDLAELDIAAAFDLVLVHGTLHFIAADRRLEALKRMRRAMQSAGRLMLFFNTSRSAMAESGQYSAAEYGDLIVSELKRLNVPLPDSERTLRRRFDEHHRRRQARESAFSDRQDVELLLQSAGFKVERCQPVDVNMPGQMQKFVAGIAKRRFMVVAQVAGKAAM
jgi:ubiquinone/menaquinone biosynthesis C-methylase UbiE